MEVERCTCECTVCQQFKHGGRLAHCYTKPKCGVRNPDERDIHDALQLKLTAWESDFVENCRRQVHQGGGLSDRQRAVLEGILEEREGVD